MMRKIRLTESQLHKVIKESVKRILKETSNALQQRAYDAMSSYGQVERANRLNDTARTAAFNRGDKFIPNLSTRVARQNNYDDAYADNVNQDIKQGYNPKDDMFYNTYGDKTMPLDVKDFPKYRNPNDAKSAADNIRRLNPNTKWGDKNLYRL
jgi:hypothetical protein